MNTPYGQTPGIPLGENIMPHLIEVRGIKNN
jgi:hypothetical protein